MENQMKKTYSDSELRDILGGTLIENKVVDTRIVETFQQIRQGKKRNSAWRRIAYGIGTVAAVLLLSFGICAANPSLAVNIPILGNIFTKVQEVFPFGKIPEDETTKLYDKDGAVADSSNNDGQNPYMIVGSDSEVSSAPAENKAAGNEGGSGNGSAGGSNKDFLYRAESDGITVTFTEYYASNQAIFIGVCIESEEAFPEFAVMGDTNYQLIQAGTDEQYSFRDTPHSDYRNIEGKLEDAHTFIGIMRMDYDTINVNSSKYEAACDEAEVKGEELPELNAETWSQYMELYEVPEEFEMQMQIKYLRGYCLEKIDEESGNKYRVRGNWEFPAMTVRMSDKDVRTIHVDEVNEQGIGVEKIELSPVELTIHINEPANRLTYAAVLDKDGRMLTECSGNAYELATVGHDVSTVTIYVCDYDEYMDEIKADGVRDDPEKYQSALEQRALFKKVIDTQN